MLQRDIPIYVRKEPEDNANGMEMYHSGSEKAGESLRIKSKR